MYNLRFIFLFTLFVFPLILFAEEVEENEETLVQPQTKESTTPDQPSSDENQQELNSGQKLQKQIEEQRSKAFKSQEQSRSEYYKYASPKSSNQSDYFKTGHPIKSNPLKKNPLR